jgi:hypothetical protein
MNTRQSLLFVLIPLFVIAIGCRASRVEGGEVVIDCIDTAHVGGQYVGETYIHAVVDRSEKEAVADYLQDLAGWNTISPALCDADYGVPATSIQALTKPAAQLPADLTCSGPQREFGAPLKAFVVIRIQVGSHETVFIDRNTILGGMIGRWPTNLKDAKAKTGNPALKQWLPILNFLYRAAECANHNKSLEYQWALAQPYTRIYKKDVTGVKLPRVYRIISERDQFVAQLKRLLSPEERKILSKAYDYFRNKERKRGQSGR